MGELIPVMCVDCLPGDKMRPATEALVRFQPMVAPNMERYYTCFHTWFVPKRLLWKNWENWITQTKVEGVLPSHPRASISFDGSNHTRLLDYLGIPNPTTFGTVNELINPMRIAAYQMIFDIMYRDQNLQESMLTALDRDYYLEDGLMNSLEFDILAGLKHRAWTRDYFTGQLPFAQKGEPVEIPIGTFQNVPVLVDEAGYPGGGTVLQAVPGEENVPIASGTPGPGLGSIFAETSQLIAQAATFNDFRLARAVQNFLELQARGGSRYVEYNLAQFGVKSSDARLNNPEYICGSRTPVQISEVLNTTGTADAPQGQMAGHGISHANGDAGNYYCEEHGYMITMMSIMPEGSYMQGLDRDLITYEDPLDIYVPAYAQLGEQAVKNKEIFAFQGAPGDAEFGYLPAWSHHRIINNRTSGSFVGDMDFWTITRKFATAPVLDDAFIKCIPRTDIFAVQDIESDYLLCLVVNKLYASRKIPIYGTPSKY